MIETREELLQGLEASGAYVCYFYLDGGACVVIPQQPVQSCTMTAFCDARDHGKIVHFKSRETGYPMFADGAKYTVWRLPE